MNVGTVLSGIISLLAHPNADDGLMSDISAQYKHHREAFDARAREMTRHHATGAGAAGAAGGGEGAGLEGFEAVAAGEGEVRRAAPEEGAEPPKKVSRMALR